MSVIFTCYDLNQKNFFKDNGIKYLVCGLNERTLRKFWVYERNEKFNSVLALWNAQRNSKQESK